jgi:FkbM family methyltransferase
MRTTRFDERLDGALAVLYESYALNSGNYLPQTRWNMRLLQAAMTEHVQFHGQLLQDAFVVAATNSMKQGQYVEIGVGDGFHLSNTLALEKHFQWEGLLIEANPFFWPQIANNRPNAKLAKTAVLGSARGPLTFKHVEDFPEISALSDYSKSDQHDRSKAKELSVETSGIVDVLRDNNIAKSVDYVSIDVEGPEIEILSAMLDAGYRPRVLTVEHNRVPERVEQLTKMLGRDYDVVLTKASQWDLWAVEKSLSNSLI